jgi:N-acetylmuramoyl-L-alanine amidase|tara:strand:+ start:1795 stop:2952 length:1158 start_codon:yes stop_codon:yes gene_type:complete
LINLKEKVIIQTNKLQLNYANIMVLILRNIFLLFLLSICFKTGYSQTGLGINTVVIDPGHGGKDPGAISPNNNYEKTVVLKVSLLLGEMIQKNFPDVKVVYTRNDDRFIGLAKRAKIANDIGADLFISIHANAIEIPSANGFETWVLGLHKSQAALEVAKFENSAILMEENNEQTYSEFDPNDPDAYIALSMRQNAFLDQSLILANAIQKDSKLKLGLRNRGVKQAGFMVLYRATMPAVLVELGFLSNPRDEKLLISKSGQIKLANHLFEGFKNYKNKYDNVDESLTKITEENINNKSFDLIDTGKIFKVQLATSSVKIPILPENFNGLKDVEVYISGKFYKYTYGLSPNINIINEKLAMAKKAGYESSFVISFQDGKRLDWVKQ